MGKHGESLRTGDFQKCLLEANMFAKAAELIKTDANDPMFFRCVYPFVVNAALSCELYLKAIVMFDSPERRFSTGHKLFDLWKLLPNDIQQKIKDRFQENYSADFEKVLTMNSNSFVEWRYAFQDDVGGTVNPYGLLFFMRILRETANCLE